MKPTRFLVVLLAGATMATACGETDAPDQEVAAEEEVRAQLAAFRAEVQSAMETLRLDVMRMEQNLTEDQRERWEELADRVDRVEDGVHRNVMRLEEAERVATEEEARAVQGETSGQLAELEAEVTRVELQLAADGGELSSKAEQKLQALRADLDEIARSAAAYAEAEGLDPREVEELRSELDEVRAELATLQELPEDAPEFSDVREEVSQRVAELTREVRGIWYDTRLMGAEAT